MRNFKKVIAAGLALLMLALSVNVSFAAEEYNDAEAVAVAKVNAAEIMTGTDKGFEPNKTLTRAEAAAIFVRMKGISKATVDQNAGATLFTDVPATHWAAGYINVASNYDIIVGVGAGKFAPEKEVSVAEFYTMAVRALGAKKLVEAEGTWPTNYVNFAIENDLAEDVAQIYTATATRKTAAVIAANTLEAKLWEKSQVKSNGEITWEAKNKTIIEDVLKYTIKEIDEDGHISKLTLPISKVSKKDKTVNVTRKVTDNCNLDEIKVGMTYEYWENKDGKIAGFWIPSSLDKVDFTEIKKDYKAGVNGKPGTIKLIVDGKEVEYDVVNGITTTDIYYNEKVTEAADVATALKAADSIRGIAYLNSDDQISKVYITKFSGLAVVDEASDKKVTLKSGSDYVGAIRTNAIALTTKDKEYFLTKDGKAMNFADLEEDDVIRFYELGSDKIVAEVVSSEVSGKITSLKSGSMKIDGKSYDLALSSTDEAKLEIKDEVTIYLNDAGKVVLVVKDEEATPDYGYVAYDRLVSGRYKATREIKLLLPNGDLTDAMEIDVDESVEEDNTFAIDTENTLQFLGKMIHYEIQKDNTVVVKKVADPEFTKVAKKSGDDKVVLDVTNKNIKVVSIKNGDPDADPVVPDTLTTLYYVTNNTRVFKLKADKAYAYKYEEIDVKDLDDFDFYTTADSFVCGIDDDTNEIETLYINKETTLKRTTAASFTFITKVWDEKDEDDNAIKVIDVILQDGTTDTFTVNKDTTGVTAQFANVKAGTYWDMAVKEGLVLEMDDCQTGSDNLLAEALGSNKYIFKQLTSSRYALSEDGDANDGEILVASDVLVLKANKLDPTQATKWTVGELSDIEAYGTTTEVSDAKSVDTLVSAISYVEEAGDEAEVKLIIYAVVEE